MAGKKSAAPIDPGLALIDEWERCFRAWNEERLRDYPDGHLVEQERALVDAQATAITAARRANYLASRQP